jgi:NAD(P)-dependent dehydrogenase (short-subunit alcohol dehydrogenase family)
VDLGLREAHVLVGGGSRGMGLAAACCFAREGAHVAVLGRDPAALQAAAERLSAAGAASVVGLRADLTVPAEVGREVAQLKARWGQLEVLVNAAGPVDVGVGAFDDLDDREWEATLNIGLLSAVRTIRECLPLLRSAPWARIVNVSAHSVRRQSAQLVAYTAAKAALTSLSKNLSLSLAPDGILVNTVSPGSILSDGMRGYLRALDPVRGVDPDSPTDAMRIMTEDFGHPAHLPRAGQPDEVGRVIAFIGSRVNSYMTGADVNVDGGSDF